MTERARGVPPPCPRQCDQSDPLSYLEPNWHYGEGPVIRGRVRFGASEGKGFDGR